MAQGFDHRSSTSWGYRAVWNWCCTRSATGARVKQSGWPVSGP